nr:endonuclease/exonuclease/phosphatase family protein [Devosia pacifica]
MDAKRIYQAIETDIAPLEPHVLALQEADEELRPHTQVINPSYVADTLGLTHPQSDPVLRTSAQSCGFFGSVLFIHPEIEITHRAVVDLPGHWHRGAVILETLWRGTPMRIATAHLSRLELLRIAQMRTFGQFIMRRPRMPTLFVGDINDWRPWSGLAFSRGLVGTRLTGPSRATFPVARPILPLDRILIDAPGTVRATRVLDSPRLRRASDHRPLWGDIRL